MIYLKKPPVNEAKMDNMRWKDWFMRLWTYIPKRVAEVSLTTQGAAIAATTIYTVPADKQGYYRMSGVAYITRAGSVSSTLGVLQFGYTDPTDGLAKATLGGDSSSAANTTGLAITRDGTFYAKASTALQYSCAYADGGGANSMQYGLRVIVEFLGP
jgi:hypothetical protein